MFDLDVDCLTWNVTMDLSLVMLFTMGSCCHSDWLSDYVAHLRINKDTILTEFTIPITDY